MAPGGRQARVPRKPVFILLIECFELKSFEKMMHIICPSEKMGQSPRHDGRTSYRCFNEVRQHGFEFRENGNSNGLYYSDYEKRTL